MKTLRQRYPFSAIVGQEELKQALLLNLVYPGIGGVLIRGEKGTAKSTAVRALEAILPEINVVKGCPCGCDPHGDALCPWCLEQEALESVSRQVRVVDLPVGSTEDRVVGSLDMETALREGRRRFEPGILADANRGILYVDEINLLDDHLVDVLLDAAAMGINTVEREGVSWSHPSRFVLVGTMNPEEGELRPQLLDRFGLCVEVRGMAEPEARLQVMTRRAAFEDDPVGFRAAWQEQEKEIAERIVAARRKLGNVAVPEDVMRAIVELAIETEVDGHRADIVMLKTVKAIAAWRGDGEATREDVMQAARLVLPHRMRRKPFQNVGSAKAVR
ncbi:ATP-binding protein [uncultured Bilophila sp.]|uniref:ATP-binding protein n=1 Tax=uncultured Bilophila sp. TaxID=529385 RepID=UPI00280B94BB|nr:ATP-binding protein [uncultured Bilophila sp.]